MAGTRAVPKLDAVEVDAKNYEPGLLEILTVIRPKWKSGDVKFKFLRQGFVNHMLACYVDEGNQDEWIVARIFGTDINFGQQRDVEVLGCELLSEIGTGPRLLCTFKNGMCQSFVKGKTFFWDNLEPFKDPKLLKAVAREYANVHSMKTMVLATEKYRIGKFKTKWELFEELMETWPPKVIIDEETTKWYMSHMPTPKERAAELAMIMGRMKKYNDPTFCHGDSNPTNIIYDDKKDKVTLVDFEGCGFNMPLFELANFITSSAQGLNPDPEALHPPEYEREFLVAYLEEMHRIDSGAFKKVDEKLVDKYMKILEVMKMSLNYFWHVMAVFIANAPARHGTDNKFFLHIAIKRLEYYMENRDRIMAIEIPE